MTGWVRVAILIAAAFLQGSLCAQELMSPDQQKDFFTYLNSGGAASACRVCLEGARKYSEDVRKEALAARTRGDHPEWDKPGQI